jgi:hypothetical protein
MSVVARKLAKDRYEVFLLNQETREAEAKQALLDLEGHRKVHGC